MDVSHRSSILAVLALVMAAGCVSNGYRNVGAGVVAIGKLRITLGSGWQRAPGTETPEKTATSRVYSRYDLERDRLIVIPGVSVGDPLFRDVYETGLPVFANGASETDIANLVAASLQAVLWQGDALIQASNVQPHGFTGTPGLMFDLEADVASAANQRGKGGAFVSEGRLYVVLFLAQSPGVYEKLREAAEAVVESMVLTVKTIRFN